jgi:hypothetical protein
MEAPRCPDCDSTAVITGNCVPGEVNPYGGLGSRFVPHGMGGLGIPLLTLCCSTCGHVWTSLSPRDLHEFIEHHGSELVKQRWKSAMFGPDHDLLDFPEAKEAATGVAEIDALVLEGKPGAAARRYRELTDTIWDQGHEIIGRWFGLTREEKLALFGWYPKAKIPFDDLRGCE